MVKYCILRAAVTGKPKRDNAIGTIKYDHQNDR
jgi:hypothetical protein